MATHLQQTLLVGTALAWLEVSTHATAGEWLLSGAAHGLVSYLGEDWGAAADLSVSLAWAPVPEVALGLEGAITFPLHTGAEKQTTDLMLRANPAVWLRYGDSDWWTYLKLGFGADSQLREGSLEPVPVLLSAAGFVVAPPDLLFYFGFELTGELELGGGLPTRSVGLGGMIGFRL